MPNDSFIEKMLDSLRDQPPPTYQLSHLKPLEKSRVWPPPLVVPPMDFDVMKRILETMSNDSPSSHLTMNPIEELRFFIDGVIEEYENGSNGNLEKMYSRARFLENFFFGGSPVVEDHQKNLSTLTEG